MSSERVYGFNFVSKDLHPHVVYQDNRSLNSRRLQLKVGSGTPYLFSLDLISRNSQLNFVSSWKLISKQKEKPFTTYMQGKYDEERYEEKKINMEEDEETTPYFPNKIIQYDSQISKLKTERERAMYIVKEGDAYIQKYNSEYDDRNFNIENIERVKGCVAIVRIWIDSNKTKFSFVGIQSYIDGLDLDSKSKRLKILKGIQYVINKSQNILHTVLRRERALKDNKRYYFRGTADARLSRGLMAIILNSLSGLTYQEIINLDIIRIQKVLNEHMKGTLTPGRNNGILSMIDHIQNLVRKEHEENLITLSKGYENEENNTKKMINIVKKQNTYREDKEGNKNKALDKHKQDLNREYHEREEGKYKSIKKNTKPKVAMLLSGGVDSSVAMNLLLRQGYDVKAYYLKIWLEDELAYLGECPWEEDWAYASSVAEQAGVELEAIDLQKEYWSEVVNYTIEEAKLGRTPNPDIMCNSRIKFGVFYDFIGKKYDYIATGHYAQVFPNQNNYEQHDSEKGNTFPENRPNNEMSIKALHRSKDRFKDQSYFLSNLSQEQLSKAIFPIGHLEKSEVRKLAKDMKLPTETRKDSQGICFLGKLKFNDFLKHYLGTSKGPVIDSNSQQLVGEHEGLWFHTIGQRKGVGPVMNDKYRNQGPWYVVNKDLEKNILYLSNVINQESGKIDSNKNIFYVVGINWILGIAPRSLKDYFDQSERSVSGKGVQMEVQIRHGARSFENARVEPLNHECTMLKVVLETKEAIAAGQYAAFYDSKNKDQCFGAGVISEDSWKSVVGND